MIHRLQDNGFQWEDEPFDVLYRRYPKNKASLRWWCNEWGEGSRFNIAYNHGLKEFMVANPPAFKISAKCCEYAKKKVAKNYQNSINADLTVTGLRKAEGGARSTAYTSCFSRIDGGVDHLRPIFWFKDDDKADYVKTFNVVHSDCYTQYGMKRTGCAGCPFGQRFEEELEIINRFEPQLSTAVNNVFRESYEYTRRYREFVRSNTSLVSRN